MSPASMMISRGVATKERNAEDETNHRIIFSREIVLSVSTVLDRVALPAHRAERGCTHQHMMRERMHIEIIYRIKYDN
jgi:hypothetical protein